MTKRLTTLTLIALGLGFLVLHLRKAQRQLAEASVRAHTYPAPAAPRAVPDLHAVAPGRDDHYRGFSFNRATFDADMEELRRKGTPPRYEQIDVSTLDRPGLFIDGPEIPAPGSAERFRQVWGDPR